jgi:predicted nucleotidyltransferase
MYPLTYEEAARMFERKWGRGLFREVMFSVNSVKLEEEVSERYGDRIFKPEGMVRIEATVSDASEAEFLPSIYVVEHAKIYDGPVVKDIYEVASYNRLFGGIADKCEKILAYGKLEIVIDNKNGEDYHRVLVGSKEAKGKDYVKSI